MADYFCLEFQLELVVVELLVLVPRETISTDEMHPQLFYFFLSIRVINMKDRRRRGGSRRPP